MLHRVVRYILTDVSGELPASLDFSIPKATEAEAEDEVACPTVVLVTISHVCNSDVTDNQNCMFLIECNEIS
jgi:hypothetical protein